MDKIANEQKQTVNARLGGSRVKEHWNKLG